MAATSLTVRVDEDTKKDFDNFCENIGINATAAVNMFIKTVVHTKVLPFPVTDNSAGEQITMATMAKMEQAIQSMRDRSTANGNVNMSLQDINEEIATYRKEKRSKNA